MVRGIFQLKMQGYNAQAIADYLNENGVLSPSRYKRQIGSQYQSGFQKGQVSEWGPMTVRRILTNEIYIGTLIQGKRGTPNYKVKQSQYQSGFQKGQVSEWGPMTVRRILTNEIYIGTLIQGKRGTPNYKVKQMRERDPSKWSVVKHNHEPIIDELMFELVQQMLKRDTRKSPQEDTVQPLAGIVFCADCMRGMCRRVVKRGTNSFYYYVCSTNKRAKECSSHSFSQKTLSFYYYVCSTNKRAKECSSHSFSQKTLESIVYRAIKRQIDLVVELDTLLSQVERSGLVAGKLKRLDVLAEEKEHEIESYQEYRRKLLEAFHEELIDRTEYDAMRQKYTAMISQAQASLEKIMEERKSALSEKSDARNWVSQFVKYQDAPQLTREMAATLIDKVFVYEDKRIKIDFNYRNEIAYHQEILQQVGKAVS